MATQTAKQKAGLQLGNAIYNTMSADPVAVQNLPAPSAENYAEFMQSIKTYNASYNSFINAVNQIVTIYINGAEDRNPFYEMVKGFITYGDTIEHMFVDTFDVQDWYECEDADYETNFGRTPSKVYSLYYSSNFHKRVKASVQDIVMNKAARDWGQVNDLISEIIDKLYTSMIGEEADAAAALLNMAHTAGWCYLVKVNDIDITAYDGLKDKMAANTIAIKAAANRLYVRGSRKYNYLGVKTRTDFGNQYIWLLPEYLAAQDVEVIASAFNMTKVEFLGHVVMCSDFGGAEDTGAVAFLTDQRWFQIWYQNKEVTYSYNAGTRLWNYFYFVDAYFAIGLFFNCVEFVSSMKTITSVTIKASQKAQKCAATDIEVDIVNGGEVGGWSSKCDWSILGQTSKRTFISPFGRLFIGPDETAASITVTATSVQDPSKTSSVAVSVTA